MPKLSNSASNFCIGFTSIILFCFFHLVNADFNHSIGPLAQCNPDMFDARQYTEACYRRCKRNDKPQSHGFVYLYSDTNPSGGPLVTSCAKFRMSQTFTETWTFSQIASTPQTSPLPISRSECEVSIKSNCPALNCSTKLPTELSPEYHYASDTIITKDFVVLVTMPSGLDYLEENVRVTPAMTSVSFPLSDGMGISGKKWYLWDSNHPASQCPFSRSQEHGCDAYGDPITLINCRRSRFVIPDVKMSKQLQGSCAHILRSSTGLLYSWQSKNELTTDGSKRIALTAVQNEQEQVAMLRIGTTNALNVLDEDLCFTQCEMLDVILRSDRKREVLTRIGGSYLLVTKTGYIRKCNPIIGCRLLSPHSFCGNPNRVGLTCHGKVYMWNPLKGYVEDGGDCNHHISGSKFSVAVGNHMYHVDDSLHIELPDSEYFGISHDPMASSEDKITKEIVDPTELRQSWEKYKNEELGMVPMFSKENKTVSNWGEGYHFGLDVGFIGRVLADVTTRISWWLTLLGSITVAMVGYKLWGWARKTSRTPIPHQVSYSPVQSAATWM
ncbi:glycoprotein [Alphacytorhabdovirus ribes]|nr:glycoprotein [Black currant cytorhabdovirus 1]